MFSDIQYLEVPLPEDIEKLKWHGDFARAEHMIERRLQQDIPCALKKRLELEREILRRMPEHYPYTWEETLELIRQSDPSFTEAQLEELFEDNRVEWIYIDGVVHFHELVASNFDKTRAAGAERRSDRKTAFLHETIQKMRQQGGMGVHFHVRAELRLSEKVQRPGEKIRVDLPLPVEYEQVHNIRLLSVEPKGEAVKILVGKGQDLHRTVCLETVYRKDMCFAVEYSFDNITPYVTLDAARVSDCQPTFYTEELKPHIHFTPYLRALTAEVVGEEMNPLLKAKCIYEYITSHVMYSFMRAYATITDITQYAAAGLKGDCGVQALLFITMCRIAGIPARWQAGQYATPLDVGSHDWAQFYVAPYGWLFADCSFGGSAFRTEDEERRAFYFGNLDPFRIPMAAEYQQDFRVPTAHLRNDPYDNQVGEVSYGDRCLHHKEFDTSYTLLEVKEIPFDMQVQTEKDI